MTSRHVSSISGHCKKPTSTLDLPLFAELAEFSEDQAGSKGP